MILQTGYTSIQFPTQKKLNRVWKLEVRKDSEIIVALEYSKKTQQVTEEMGEFFIWLTGEWARRKFYHLYNDFFDMQAYAVLLMCTHMHKFDPSKSTRAFKYFTMVAEHAFRQYIAGEAKQSNIIQELKEQLIIFDGVHFDKSVY